MQYPSAPFDENFNAEALLTKYGNDSCKDSNSEKFDLNLKDVLKWLCTTPSITTYRVNTLTHNIEDVLALFKSKVDAISVTKHASLPEVIVLSSRNTENLDLNVRELEVIVDVHCAAAVLRGADIFAPGVLGMQAGIRIEDKVSIFADLEGKCKRGFQKTYDSKLKCFVGNGTVKLNRHQLFSQNASQGGVAVKVDSSISGCPNIGDDFLPEGCCLLQNLPSIVCVHVLKPQPGDVVLDMCAAPGNKTTHIAAVMKNKEILVAIDKTQNKVKQLRATCEKFHANVHIFQADSSRIYDSSLASSNVLNGPPFSGQLFDKVLLDAPCSALGKRPQLRNNITEKVVRSYVPLQRKLLESAVHLLKNNGRLVYSTCTITIAENEAMVAWVLKKFDCLHLIQAEPRLGTPGWKGSELTDAQRHRVQRFAHDSKDLDTVGFFIACFIKKI